MEDDPVMAPHRCCCCGKREGNTVTLWRCSNSAQRWPFVCETMRTTTVAMRMSDDQTFQADQPCCIIAGYAAC